MLPPSLQPAQRGSDPSSLCLTVLRYSLSLLDPRGLKGRGGGYHAMNPLPVSTPLRIVLCTDRLRSSPDTCLQLPNLGLGPKLAANPGLQTA